MIDAEKKMSMGQTANIILGNKGARVSANSLPGPRKAVAEGRPDLNQEWGSSNFAISRSHDFANFAPRQAQPSASTWMAAAPESRSLPELYDSFIQGDITAASEMAKRGKKAIPFFIKALSAEFKDIQFTAIVELGRYGPAAEPAIPELAFLSRDYWPPELTKTFFKIGPPVVSFFNKRLSRKMDPEYLLKVFSLLERFGPLAAPTLPVLSKIPRIYKEEGKNIEGYIIRPLISVMRAIGPKAAPSLMTLASDPELRYDRSYISDTRSVWADIPRAFGSFGPLPNEMNVVPFLVEQLEKFAQRIEKQWTDFLCRICKEKDFYEDFFPFFKEIVEVIESVGFDGTCTDRLGLLALKYIKYGNAHHMWSHSEKRKHPPIEETVEVFKKFGTTFVPFFIQQLYSKDESECRVAAEALVDFDKDGIEAIPILAKVRDSDASAGCREIAAEAHNLLLRNVR